MRGAEGDVARRPAERRGDAPERELELALARAKQHAKSAVAEALAAVRALLDAASIATSGGPAGANPLFEVADRWIARASRSWAADGALSDELGVSIAAALDDEIARWELRAKSDDDARPVLRAFLGLRELLWELGVRAPRDAGEPRKATATARRVERVSVQG
jgi:hypothetical protein